MPPENTELIEWPTTTLWWDENGILYSVSKKVPQQTLEEAKASVEMFKELTGNKKVCMIIDNTNSAPTTKEIRDYAAEELEKLSKAIAIISNSPLSRMTANLFLGLRPPSYPVKIFKNEQDAKKWILKYL